MAESIITGFSEHGAPATQAPPGPQQVPVQAADLDIHVGTRLTGLAWWGAGLVATGLVLLVAGCAAFVVGFPGVWYAGTPGSLYLMRAVVAGVGLGLILFLLGATMFLHGRDLHGQGRLEATPPEQRMEVPVDGW